MKKWLIFACCLALFSCARNRAVPYVPNPNVTEPAKVIERVIKSQPASYAGAVPYAVSAKNDCIEMQMTEPGGWLRSSGDAINMIYYKNIGRLVLNKTDIWYIEILDRSGYWMYYVWSFDENEAKLFIDAIYTVMGKQ
jgi:hypothetical protein